MVLCDGPWRTGRDADIPLETSQRRRRGHDVDISLET